jgi:hypothetical protein
MKQNVELLSNKTQSRLTNKLLTLALAAFTGVTGLASLQPALAQSDDAKRFETPTVFQAAGPSAASIQSTVDQYRAALGAVNNGNNPGQTSGHREINWDGGSPTNAATSLSGTPFNHVLEHPRRQHHHTRKWLRPGSAVGLGGHVWELELRHNLPRV